MNFVIWPRSARSSVSSRPHDASAIGIALSGRGERITSRLWSSVTFLSTSMSAGCTRFGL
ncbi:MAG: hypothetical protein FJZ92_04960 [Chloroflexi bacterium]|nr:hypothetical protein [Chloroflexota bacterium]